MMVRSLGAALSRLSLTPAAAQGSVAGVSGVQQKLQLPSLPQTGFTYTSSISTCNISTTVTTSSTSSYQFQTPSILIKNLAATPVLPQVSGISTTSVAQASSLNQMHRRGPHKKKRVNKNPLGKNPQMRGIVLKTLVKKPKKPNSANRKCVLLRLTNGKEMVAYVPGEGHNLQEHNIVLVRVGRLRDVPGVKIKCIRGKYDLQHVMKKSQ